MNRGAVLLGLSIALVLVLTGCGDNVKADPKAEMPPSAEVEREQDANTVKVDHPEQFPLATATEQYISTLYGYDLAKGALTRGIGTTEEILRQIFGGSR